MEWNPSLVVRAVVWLSHQTGKAILKLTQGDYAEHRLSSLVARYGSPGALNGEVFNALGAKIRGRSKLPRGKRIACFSPHPDDDVISMGGILHKLAVNEQRDHGRLHDQRQPGGIRPRRAPSHRLPATALGGAASPAEAAHALGVRIERFLAGKRAGDVDIAEVQDAKRIIRESEAVAGIRTLGLDDQAARFLELPFYHTGKVKKDPIGQADVAIVRALLEEIRPDLVFVAGDLSDPHGTHRLCKEAIERALEEAVAAG